MKKQNKKARVNNLVIGSDGFVGTALCAYLEKMGERVTHFDIKRAKQEDGRNAILPLQEFDRVYFLAWDVGGAKYLYRNNTQLHQLNWNVDLLKNIMPQLQKHKTPFVFVSSQLAEETDTVYGSTKKLGELWTKQIGGACVRLWNVYGALEEPTEKSHVVGDFVHQALATGKIQMMSMGEEKRQFIHIQDVCEGLHYVLKNNLNDVIYDLTSFEWSTVRYVADLIGLRTKAKVLPGAQKGSTRIIAVIKGKPHGWNAKINLKKGIKMMVEEAILFRSKNLKPVK